MGNCHNHYNVISILNITRNNSTQLSYHINEIYGSTLYDCLKKYKIIYYVNYKNIMSNDNRKSNFIFLCSDKWANNIYLVLNCYKFDINIDNLKKIYYDFLKYIILNNHNDIYPKLFDKCYYYCNRTFDISSLNLKNKTFITNLMGKNNIISDKYIFKILKLFGAIKIPNYYNIQNGTNHIIDNNELIAYYNKNIPQITIIIQDNIIQKEKNKFINKIIKYYGANNCNQQIKNVIANKIVFKSIDNTFNYLFNIFTPTVKKFDEILNPDLNLISFLTSLVPLIQSKSSKLKYMKKQ
jgi:hypothetical protein